MKNKLSAWIIYNKEDYKRNNKFANMIEEELKSHGVVSKVLLVEKIKFGVTSNGLSLLYDNSNIDLPDFAIVRTIYPLLSRHLEMLGVDVYNNSLVADICNDKAKTYQYISTLGINTIPSSFVKCNYISYYQTNKLIPKDNVVKTVDGHGGKEVYKYSDELKIHDKDIVVQDFIQGKGQDLRVYIMDNKILASVLRTSKSNFKSNFSLGGDVELFKITPLLEDYVYKIIDKFNDESGDSKTRGLIFAGIDFLIDGDGKFYFNEIEDVVGSRMLYQCSNINIVEKFIKTILKRY